MKRILAIMVLVAYTATAIGFSFSVHYCGGSLQGVYLSPGNEAGCCGDEEEAAGCCEDRVVSAKSNDDHTQQLVDFTLHPPLSAFLPAPDWKSHVLPMASHFGRVARALHGPAPPLIRAIPIFLLYRNLRI